jgi:hypothetical protein
VSSDGEDELGRPRYRALSGDPAAPGRPGATGPSGAVVNKTAPAAVSAIAFAAVGWLLPLIGGIVAVRRAKTALRVIAAAGGELDGVQLAVWAKRLGWCYIIIWSAVLFWYLGGPAVQLVYSFVVK